MAPRWDRNVKLEHDQAHASTNPNGEGQGVMIIDLEDSDNEEGSLGIEKKSSKANKTDEEKAVNTARTMAATEAVSRLWVSSPDLCVSKRMKEDAHEFYSQIKQPNPASNARHISQREHLRDNPTLKPEWCGSDHYGHWHAQQHYQDPILETSDVHNLNATTRQLLLQFLRYTGGPMTRLLDFWFGVWEPDLRQRYRDIYAKSPEFARLPPVNVDHPETYCLRVAVCNRPTDEHRDQSDIKGGLTGLVHLGDFKGAAMCINKLGIALDGYGDGAVLLFRGTEMRHYISQWSGNYRYAFDHTTHQSVENAIKAHEQTGQWGDKKKPAKSKPSGPPKGDGKSNKPDDQEDKKPDDGDGPVKPQRKKRKRSPDDDDDDEGTSGKPAPKKSRKRSHDDDVDGTPDKEPAPKQNNKI